MLLDIDHFKAVNDNHGHAVGDRVLSIFARRVRQSIRATDFVARLAGDEFVVILRALQDRREAEVVARKIVKRTGRPFALDDRVLRITTSVGIAMHDERTGTPADLLARADAALYQAKEAGRNTYRLAA
jgi:diguanylate cyclase (GGDEF)-like protein